LGHREIKEEFRRSAKEAIRRRYFKEEGKRNVAPLLTCGRRVDGSNYVLDL
jgi:hypothetical protein